MIRRVSLATIIVLFEKALRYYGSDVVTLKNYADSVNQILDHRIGQQVEAAARETEWHHRFLTFTHLVASWSKDPSTKVGAAIVDAKRRILGTGYNGFPRGVCDSQERYSDRPTKYAMTVHAEANAILNAVREVEGAIIYCTHAPCAECAKLIIQSGLSKVVCSAGDLAGWGESQKTARIMFDEAGVQFLALDVPAATPPKR